jgi:hypothetical protein
MTSIFPVPASVATGRSKVKKSLPDLNKAACAQLAELLSQAVVAIRAEEK